MAFTANWNPLGEVFYRKLELYCMEWGEKVDLNNFIISVAPYGGPIALIRDESKSQRPSVSSKPIIHIFSAAGREISSIRWNSGKILSIGWSHTEDLLCVQDDGSVLVYDIFGNFKRTFGLGQAAKEDKVIECKFFFSPSSTTGIAIMTTNFRIYIISNVEEPRIRRFAEIPGVSQAPSCWCIINLERETRALVAKNADLYLLDHQGHVQTQHPEISTPINSYIEMALSFNNKFLALFGDNGLLWIGSSDLQKCYCEFDTKCPAKPEQLVWCDTGAVVGYWENILLMVGPQKDWVKYSYESQIHLVPEQDGIRIVGNEIHEFLQRVPLVVESIFKIGSMEPGAILYEASKEFQRGSQRADEYIRMIKESLHQAVEQCIQAAGHEFEAATQKQLLRAASFGKCFLTDFRPDAFVNMGQMLRVLNAVRDPTVGIPLTYSQLQQLTLPVLIDRLVLRHHFCLAIRICQYLKLPEAEGESRILAHWACYKVQQTMVDDEDVAQAIAEKLGDTPGVSYSEIANKALECGRNELAIRLLDFEAKAAEQVPLLMKMKRDERALEKAIESGDTDLVYTVLLHLKDNMSQGDFFLAIRNMPTAFSLFLQLCRQQNRPMLKDLYYQEDNFQEEANCKVIESYDEERIEARLSQLTSAQDSYNKARNEWASKECEDTVKLLRIQRRLEEEFNKPYLNLSVHQTIYQLVLDCNHKRALQLKKEFRVPERRYWWLKIEAIAESGDFVELDKFAKSAKSPIGYEPFIEVCIKRKNKLEATKYLSRVNPKNKVQCQIKIGLLEEAAEQAFANRNEEELNLVLAKCDQKAPLVSRISNMKTQLASKR